MASVVDELNELIKNERGIVEGTKTFLNELDSMDKDIAAGSDDVRETAQWSCDGLYHRIVQLHGMVTLDISDLSEKITNKRQVKSKLEVLYGAIKDNRKMIKAILKRDDLDEDTRGFLEDLLRGHQDPITWCESKLSEWKADI